MTLSEKIAKDLLRIKAVFFRPEEPFTWASGIKSPVYCDNRLTLTAPEVRTDVEKGLAQLIGEEYPSAEVLMGTSTDQQMLEEELLIREEIADVVLHYAENAKKAGLDGIVCSPLEAGKVHEACGESFLTVTPGVRFADGDIGDQKRVMPPAEAKRVGSDYIVVGRPITAAEDPVAAYQRCCDEFID